MFEEEEKGRYIEKKPSARKLRMLVFNAVLVIDPHVKDLVDTGGSVFVGDEQSCKTVNRSGGTRRA